MKRIIFIIAVCTVFFCKQAFAQQGAFRIEGTVYDETGETLPSVSIYIKNKITIGTSSDADGKFSIRVSRGDVLVFSYIGYENEEYLATEAKSDLEIRFTKSAVELDEVMVTALGTQRKISTVAAITSVDVADLQTPVTSVQNLLGGRVAGIISMQTSGEPGKNIADFWIRGIGTFGYNSGALVLVDGLEGDLNSLDPADIESFSILKDASATAVYGVRGANGVVLVATKKGTEGKLTITGRVNYTLSHLVRVPEYLRAYDYALLANEAAVLRNESPIYSVRELDIIQDGTDRDIYPDVSWQDEILNRNFFRKSFYLSARGGATAAKYFISLGGSNETAAYKVEKNSPYASNVGYNTYTYRANIDLQLSPTTDIFFGTDGFLSISNNPGVASTDYLWYAQTNITPLRLPVVYSNGQLPAMSGGDNLISPYVMINRLGTRSDQEFKGKFTLALNQDFSMLLDGLKFRMQGAYDITSWFREQRLIMPDMYEAVGRDQYGKLITIQRVTSNPASYGRSSDQYRKYHMESTLNYDKLFAQDHRVSGLIYYYISDHKYSSESNSNLSAIPVRYQGVSSRFTYGFRDTYMVDFNFGYTGSENFQPGKQYGFFPSIALGWIPTSYEWIQDKASWLSFFKIRASHGIVGNDRITNRRFPYLTMVNVSNVSPWGSAGTEGVSESIVGANNLIWENSIQSNLGIDARLFDENLQFTVDVFKNIRDGIFQQRVQIPGYVGLTTMPFGNIGKMENYGSDGNVSFTHPINDKMSFTVRGNYSYARNNVKNWEEANPRYPYQEVAGYPYGIVRGLIAVGLFKDRKDVETSPIQTYGTVMPGDIKYRDVNGDGQINDDDKVPLSYSPTPLLMYGFGGEFRYKDFTVGILFKGTGKTDYFHVGYGNGHGYVPFYNGVTGNVLSIVKDPENRWIPMEYALEQGIDPSLAENPNARFPRMQYGYNSNNSQLSTFWKGDCRYLRLQEITLNYNLRHNLFRKIGVSSIDLQLVGNNLYVWDKVKLFDPEQARYNGVIYPIPTTYALQVYINM
ncbi:MAG: TonB-dependent receptor [Tannerella sp.]|jgi:TonB-linked SusC/RagA family outer membrane protein|nr:TonB-dependent receptor [Tannerella sp.]